MGLVFKAHRLLYHSTLGLRVIKKKKDDSFSRRATLELLRIDLFCFFITLTPRVE